mgnify:CR=1 FL=1
MLERRVRTAKYLVLEPAKTLENKGKRVGRKSLSCGGFRVSPVMTTSIPLRIADAAKLRRYYNSRQGKNQVRIFLLHKSLACLTPFFVL